MRHVKRKLARSFSIVTRHTPRPPRPPLAYSAGIRRIMGHFAFEYVMDGFFWLFFFFFWRDGECWWSDRWSCYARFIGWLKNKWNFGRFFLALFSGSIGCWDEKFLISKKWNFQKALKFTSWDYIDIWNFLDFNIEKIYEILWNLRKVYNLYIKTTWNWMKGIFIFYKQLNW